MKESDGRRIINLDEERRRRNETGEFDTSIVQFAKSLVETNLDLDSFDPSYIAHIEEEARAEDVAALHRKLSREKTRPHYQPEYIFIMAKEYLERNRKKRSGQ